MDLTLDKNEDMGKMTQVYCATIKSSNPIW